MDLEALSSRVVSLLVPHLPVLAGKGNQEVMFLASRDQFLLRFSRLIWEKINPEITAGSAVHESLAAIIASPDDEDALVSLRFHLARLLKSKPALAKSLVAIWDELESAGLSSHVPVIHGGRADRPGPADATMDELEMIRLLRRGFDPERIARRFGTRVEDLYRRNAAFSLGGVAALIGHVPSASWLESIDSNEPLLRRLEMVLLHKTGTPSAVIAEQFKALPEYVEMLVRQFDAHGVAGILTEEDVQKFRMIHPETVRICTFNLHGYYENDGGRLRRIARDLSDFQPDILALQEVISGAGVEETSSQIAVSLSSMTGSHYRREFSYCHRFQEKYPEGIALVARHPFRQTESIDLTSGLGEGVAPLLPRKAQIGEVEIFRHRIIVACVHLDHTEDTRVRPAQMEKLLKRLHTLEAERKSTAVVVAGDFNDREDSEALELLKSAGYRDAYRACHKAKGNTFPLPDPTARVDYIMVKGDAEILSSGIILNSAELSDHAGVFVVIR